MKISHSYFQNYSCPRINHTAPTGLFVCDGKTLERDQFNKRIVQEMDFASDLTDKSNPKSKTSLINTKKIHPKKTTALRDAEIQPHILKSSRSSSHYPLTAPVYTYLQLPEINPANQKRAEDISFYRKVYVDDGRSTFTTADMVNRIWFPNTTKMRSLERMLA
jgi:hypothetical protein